MLRYVPGASWRWAWWGSHPIGPDKLPRLTLFCRPCPPSPAGRLPYKLIDMLTFPSFIFLFAFQHILYIAGMDPIL